MHHCECFISIDADPGGDLVSNSEAKSAYTATHRVKKQADGLVAGGGEADLRVA